MVRADIQPGASSFKIYLQEQVCARTVGHEPESVAWLVMEAGPPLRTAAALAPASRHPQPLPWQPQPLDKLKPCGSSSRAHAAPDPPARGSSRAR